MTIKKAIIILYVPPEGKSFATLRQERQELKDLCDAKGLTIIGVFTYVAPYQSCRAFIELVMTQTEKIAVVINASYHDIKNRIHALQQLMRWKIIELFSLSQIN